ncbi:hypothetical protein A3Q56_01151 [Intoshia linei]|uniref:Uncharacterized protein n=1 Tax=Intoshia linei TaxID=1819745 RepID=A0A177BA45_9BILA|nr:hypothetical protein A3Q56_01151 [Intoshia linei]
MKCMTEENSDKINEFRKINDNYCEIIEKQCECLIDTSARKSLISASKAGPVTDRIPEKGIYGCSWRKIYFSARDVGCDFLLNYGVVLDITSNTIKFQLKWKEIDHSGPKVNTVTGKSSDLEEMVEKLVDLGAVAPDMKYIVEKFPDVFDSRPKQTKEVEHEIYVIPGK